MERVRPRRRRPAQHFIYTIPRCSLSREDVLRIISPVVGDRYVVARELHKDGTPHIHCYFETKGRYLLDDLKVAMDGYVDGDLQVCKCPRNAMIYCLKEDKEPLRDGLPILSFADELNEWCRTHPKFILDDFTTAHCHRVRYIQQYHAQYWAPKRQPNLDGVGLVSVRWVKELAYRLAGRQHIFLTGPTAYGKSTAVAKFCTYLAGPDRLDDIIYPSGSVGNFEFGSLSPRTLFIILDDKFTIEYHRRWRGFLHSLLDGHPVSVDQKFVQAQHIVFTGQIIIIGNYGIPQDDPALCRRFQTIHADEKAVRIITPTLPPFDPAAPTALSPPGLLDPSSSTSDVSPD